jgi:hypothetical protein
MLVDDILNEIEEIIDNMAVKGYEEPFVSTGTLCFNDGLITDSEIFYKINTDTMTVRELYDYLKNEWEHEEIV